MDSDWFIQFNLDKEGNRKTNCLIDTDVTARLAQVTGEVKQRSLCLERREEVIHISQNDCLSCHSSTCWNCLFLDRGIDNYSISYSGRILHYIKLSLRSESTRTVIIIIIIFYPWFCFSKHLAVYDMIFTHSVKCASLSLNLFA